MDMILLECDYSISRSPNTALHLVGITQAWKKLCQLPTYYYYITFVREAYLLTQDSFLQTPASSV